MLKKFINKTAFLYGYLMEKNALANRQMVAQGLPKIKNTVVKGTNVKYNKPKQTAPEGPAIPTNQNYQAPLGKV